MIVRSVFQCMGLLVLARSLSVSCSPIMDCDETFNYWEPLHYLLFGRGFQTWEYSPEFGLRTYAYVLLHAVFGLPQYVLHLVRGGALGGFGDFVPETEKVIDLVYTSRGRLCTDLPSGSTGTAVLHHTDGHRTCERLR